VIVVDDNENVAAAGDSTFSLQVIMQRTPIFKCKKDVHFFSAK
jgi:hypothetical protein